MSEQWFEIVDRWTDARGAREMIVFCGPLDACVMNLVNNGNSDNLIIRPISF